MRIIMALIYGLKEAREGFIEGFTKGYNKAKYKDGNRLIVIK